MPRRFNDNSKARISTVLCVVFLAASVLMMTLYSNENPKGPLHTAQAFVHSTLSPVGAAGARGGSVASGLSGAVTDATADPQKLSELQSRNAELSDQLAKAEEYRLEAERLESLLKLKDAYNIDGVSGRVVGRSTDAWSQTITVDVGSEDGVEIGLTVIGPGGVVGQVASTGPGSSTVRLLSDPSSGVAAMIQSSRAEGIVRGSLSGLLYLENVDPDIAVSLGDVILTSGLGGSYSKGLLIGSVVRVDGAVGDDARSIVVAQNTQIDMLEEIIVVFSATEATTGSMGISTRKIQASTGDAAPTDGSGDPQPAESPAPEGGEEGE